MTTHPSPIPPVRLSAALPRLAGQRVLVVGDVFLDEYQIGHVQRLSREAPVPVLEQSELRHLPGGAGNPAANCASLGSEALLLAVRGADHGGELLARTLIRHGIQPAGLIADPGRPTSRKTRIVAAGSYVFAHHLARVDHLDRSPLAPAIADQLRAKLGELLPTVSAVLVSDYRVNVITPALVDAMRELAAAHHVLTVVDSQGDLGQFRGFDLIRCNRQEAERFSGRPLRNDDDFARLMRHLREQLQCRQLVISRGAEGLSLLTAGDEVVHLPAHNRSQVFDVTGAGDTLIAVLTLALAAGLDLHTAAALGNVAAGIAVRQLGAVAVTPQQIQAALEQPSAGPPSEAHHASQ